MGRQSKLIMAAVLVAMSFSSCVFAAADSSQNPAVADREIRDLASHQQWLHLLHYRIHPYTFRFLSQNDSPEFFLAKDGKRDAYAELVANINAFLMQGQGENESAQCRFPARYHWLKQRLPQAGFVDRRQFSGHSSDSVDCCATYRKEPVGARGGSTHLCIDSLLSPRQNPVLVGFTRLRTFIANNHPHRLRHFRDAQCTIAIHIKGKQILIALRAPVSRLLALEFGQHRRAHFGPV